VLLGRGARDRTAVIVWACLVLKEVRCRVHDHPAAAIPPPPEKNPPRRGTGEAEEGDGQREEVTRIPIVVV